MKVYNFIKYTLLIVSFITIIPAMIIIATPAIPMDGVAMSFYYGFFISGSVGGVMAVFGDLILELLGVEGVDPL